MKRLLKVILPAVMLAGCSKVPSGIIKPEEMSQLMADVHTGEAVVDMNRMIYGSDSAKQALKQSIYKRHGVTSEQVDSSFSWYGRNITYYMDVYDRTIEILEQRNIEIGNRVAAEAAMSVAGDSVDVWAGPRFLRITDLLPSKTLVFSFSRDPNWERGDQYTWRAKFFNSHQRSNWQIVAEYANGNIEFLDVPIEGDGWKEINMFCDSTLDATRIYGYLETNNKPGSTMVIDSVGMVRKRLDPDRYQRRYAQRKLRRVLPPVEIDTNEEADESTSE